MILPVLGLMFKKDGYGVSGFYRYYGFCVRQVSD